MSTLAAPRRRLAIVGSGVSGLVTAWMLQRFHDVTVFEADGRIGGHVRTVDVEWAGRTWAVDTGFIVFNHRTYPAFTSLLEQLGVATRPSSMSFSVRSDRAGLEYNGTSLNGLFAQRRNLFRPSFHRMIRDVLRFNREAPELLREEGPGPPLGAWLEHRRYSREFIEHYVVPMGAAIWSARPEVIEAFPARAFARFFHNHGMLSVGDRPVWRVIEGGSRTYVERLVRPFGDRLRRGVPVRGVRRADDGVTLALADGSRESFDGVVLACHSDQALALLSDPSPAEREVLGAIPYQENQATLHVDSSVLPRRRRAWAAWNYRVGTDDRARVGVTYDMNILQGLEAPATFCVSLNDPGRIDPGAVLDTVTFHHPVFSAEGFAAQARHDEISGVRRTFYCGAWWGWGFHEDGVASALAVARQLGVEGLPPALVDPEAARRLLPSLPAEVAP